MKFGLRIAQPCNHIPIIIVRDVYYAAWPTPIKSMQVAPEQASRGLDLAAEPAGDESSEAPVITSSRSKTRSAFSAAAALAGGLIGLDGQLPKFEEAAKELVHPLFEKLKQEVSVCFRVGVGVVNQIY